jgi:hypothetical protein
VTQSEGVVYIPESVVSIRFRGRYWKKLEIPDGNLRMPVTLGTSGAGRKRDFAIYHEISEHADCEVLLLDFDDAHGSGERARDE